KHSTSMETSTCEENEISAWRIATMRSTRDSRPRAGRRVRLDPTLRFRSALHVASTLDDPAVAHAHQVDAANRLVVTLVEAPVDDRAIIDDDDVFEVEADPGRGRDALPKLDAGLAPD